MADYDGDIKLSMSLDPKDVKAASKSLQDDIKQIFEQSAGKELDTKFKKLETSMSKSASKAQTLQDKLKQLEGTRIPTQEYAEIKKQIDTATNSLTKLQERQERFLETGGKASSGTYKKMEYDIAQLENTIKYAEGELQELVDTGKAFTLGSDTAQYQNTVQQLADVNNQMRVLVSQTEDGSKGMQDLGKSTSATNKIFNSFKSVLGAAGKGLANVAKKLWGIISSAVKSGLQRLSGAIKGLAGSSNSADFSMKKLFWNMMKYGLGIRSLYALVNKLKSAITEGINNMVQFNGGANRTNAAMTQLTSSLAYLKNAWGAAFAPILSFVAPVLSQLISMIASAVNAIAHLFAALTGQKTVIQAKYNQKDYASSLSSGGGNSGKSAQEKYEEAQKKAQEKYEKKLADVREKNAKKVAKAEEKQAKAAAKLAKEQEEANKQLGHYDKLNVIAIEQQEELEDYTPELLEEPELEPVNWEDFMDAGGAGDAFADMFEEVPVQLSDFMKQLKDLIEAEDWEGIGQLIAQKINDGMKVVDDWINNVFRPMGVLWAERIARILNGAVSGLDWSLLGKTVADGINAAFDIVNTFLTTFDFKKFGSGIGTAIKSWFDNIEWDLIGQTFANKWNALIDIISGIVNTPGLWESIGNSIATFVNNWFDTINWEELAKTFVTGVNGIFVALDTAITNIDFASKGKRIGDNLHTMISGIDWKNIGKSISDFFKGCFDFLGGIDWTQLSIDLGTALADLIAGVDWIGLAGRLAILFIEFIGVAITLMPSMLAELLVQIGEVFDKLGMEGAAGFFKGLGEGLKDIVKWIKEHLIDPLVKTVKDLLGIHSPSTVFADFGKDIVTGLYNGIKDNWSGFLINIGERIGELKTKFETAWKNIKETASLKWGEIKSTMEEKFGDAKKNLETSAGTLKGNFETTFRDMKTSVVTIFQNLWSGVRTVINSIIGGVERMANSVISAINSMVDALNALSFEVPDWVPEIGGKTFGFDLPHVPTINIPRLAQGAVIPPNKEFLAVLGDQQSGTNIETPLNTMIEAFTKALDSRGGNNHEPIVLQLDGEVIAQAVWDEEEKRYKQRGDWEPLYT